MKDIKDLFAVYQTPHRAFLSNGDIINEYKITGTLGEGTFGIVYKVTGPDNTVKALKLIKLWEIPYEKERKAIVDRFVREFEISAINSPFLVKSHGYGKYLGNPYITMEYCENGSLGGWIGKFKEHINYEQIIYQILRGLQELHNKGYFHRDIKPQNILLTYNNDAKLTDFGIAGQKTTRLTVTNIFGKVDQIFGTWAYLAPEQANNKVAFKALDAVTDIFSFGVTLFELFTGEYPFPPNQINSETDLVEYLDNAKRGHFNNLHRKKHLIPENYHSILEQCLQPDYQHKRFKSISDILLRLGFKSIDFTPKLTDINKIGLEITYGDESFKKYDLSHLLNIAGSGILTVGRKDPSVKNDIEIAELLTTYISRKHATIEKWTNPTRWVIRDGQWTGGNGWTPSVNGLFVNSSPVGISGVKLNLGDIITLGDTIMRVIQL